jgi:amidohydrolase
VLCCEYDALPGIGHGCGHNVVAAAGLGAGIALAGLAAELGGRVTVLGTPAEEGGGGKVRLAGLGAFAGATAAMLVHPGAEETVLPHINAASTLEVTVVGRAAHASMAPERGVNALDGLVLGYLGLAALRQHLVATDKVHGVLTDGGRLPAVVPARAAGRFMVRSADEAGLVQLRRRVLACLAGGAEAAGARLVTRWLWPDYQEMWHNLPLAGAFEANLRSLGRRPVPPADIPAGRAASTDLGNVSHLVPAIHPKLAICPPGVAQHSPAFAACAAGPAADRAVLDGAKALAMTAVDLWLQAGLRAAVRAAFPGLTAADRHPTGPRPARSAGGRRPAGRPGAAAGLGR